MTTQDETKLALARRALACTGWRWMPGMLDETGARVVAADGDRLVLATPGGGADYRPNNDYWKPDLDDAATLGCLLDLVREAWGVSFATAVRACRGAGTREASPPTVGSWERTPSGGYKIMRWAVVDEQNGRALGRWCETEAEALVAALEAAP